MKIERLRADLEKARQKAVEWQARAKDIERQITEHENLEIIQAVRGITALSLIHISEPTRRP